MQDDQRKNCTSTSSCKHTTLSGASFGRQKNNTLGVGEAGLLLLGALPGVEGCTDRLSIVSGTRLVLPELPEGEGTRGEPP